MMSRQVGGRRMASRVRSDEKETSLASWDEVQK